MDTYEATRVVFSRVQALDPDNAAKIMGSFLLQDNGDKNMIRLAFSPDSLLHSLVVKARNDLALVPPSPQPPYLLHRQAASSPRLVSPSSWAPPPPFSRSASINGRDDLIQPGDELFSPAAPFFGGGDLADELMGPKGGDLLYQDLAGECRSPGAVGDAVPYPYWGHRRSFSDASDAAAAGWRPCLYFAKGYCKNGSSCRFDHGPPADADAAVEQQCQELLLRSRSQRLMASGYPYSPAGSPSSPSAKCINFLLQQQSDNQQRAAAAAALMLGGGGADARSFIGRARMERGDFEGMLNPGSRQIYLTFPADSTFREEDVSNYFSIYGPVQDVRIPYQQKRMFGFVTFVYSDTVKIILAKGNPHFVCDARVLVKPYKEKGKVPEKFRSKPLQQQQAERGDLSGFDGSDPFDLQQLGARMLYNGGVSQEALMRRKLEQQQQQQYAAELQQAIELQSRRFAGLQLLDLEAAARNRAAFYPNNGNGGHEQLQSQSLSPSSEDKSPSPAALLSSSSGSGGSGVAHTPSLRQLSVNVEAPAADSAADKEKSAADAPHEDNNTAFQESLELNLPDSPFASPSRAFSTSSSATSPHSDTSSSSNSNNQPSITAPFKSCFLQIPRHSSSSSVGL